MTRYTETSIRRYLPRVSIAVHHSLTTTEDGV